MWKNGQLVTIDNKVYRVTMSDGGRLKACYMCCSCNRPIPCGGRYNYSGEKEAFWRGTCLDKVPEGAYLKPIANDKKGARLVS